MSFIYNSITGTNFRSSFQRNFHPAALLTGQDWFLACYSYQYICTHHAVISLTIFPHPTLNSVPGHVTVFGIVLDAPAICWGYLIIFNTFNHTQCYLLDFFFCLFPSDTIDKGGRKKVLNPFLSLLYLSSLLPSPNCEKWKQCRVFQGQTWSMCR